MAVIKQHQKKKGWTEKNSSQHRRHIPFASDALHDFNVEVKIYFSLILFYFYDLPFPCGHWAYGILAMANGKRRKLYLRNVLKR